MPKIDEKISAEKALSDYDLELAYEVVNCLDASPKQKVKILHWITGMMIASGFPPDADIRRKIVETLRE